jgi:hypothetical protein
VPKHGERPGHQYDLLLNTNAILRAICQLDFSRAITRRQFLRKFDFFDYFQKLNAEQGKQATDLRTIYAETPCAVFFISIISKEMCRRRSIERAEYRPCL